MSRDRRDLAWIAPLAGLVLFFVAVTVQKVWSADFWWQIRNGQWIIEHGDVPTTENYSHTMRGNPLREMRWLYCVFAYVAYAKCGAWLLVVWQSAMVGAAWLTIAWPVRRVFASGWGCAVVGLGLAAGFGRWVVRPELFTFLFIAVSLVTLERAAKEPRARWVWALPLVQVLWVNTHTLFVFGPLLAWAFVATDALERLATRATLPARGLASGRLVLLALLVTGACWVNPYGHWGAMYAEQMYRESGPDHPTAKLLFEMKSPLGMPPASWTWDLWAGAALAALCLVSFVLWARSARGSGIQGALRGSGIITRLVIFGAFAYLAVKAQRNVALMTIPAAWVTLRNLDAWLGVSATIEQRWVHRTCLAASGLLTLLLALAGWYVATDRYSARLSLTREFGLGLVEWAFPVGAGDFILTERPAGNLWNNMKDGSYFVWATAGVLPVYLDGRTDAYGPEMLSEFASTGAANFVERTRARGVRTAVVPNSGFDDIAILLRALPDWKLVYLDHASLVFVRDTPETHEWLAPRAWTPDRLPPVDATAITKPGLLSRVPRAWKERGLADSLLAIGAVVQALPFLERVNVVQPGDERTASDLAGLLLARGQEGDSERAGALLRPLGRERRASAFVLAGRTLSGMGSHDRAAAELRKAVAILPDDAGLREFLGDACFQSSDYRGAREQYLWLLGRGRASPSVCNKLGGAADALGDDAAAIRAYEQSLAMDPGQHLVWNLLGGAFGRSGDLERAGACFAKALELKPDFAPAMRNLDKVRSLKR